MTRNHARYGVTVALVVLLAASFGCILDPKEDPAPGPGPISQYKDRTEPDHCVTNLVKAYQDRNLTRIEELFNENYKFLLQPEEVGPGEDPFIDRADDIRITNNMFKAVDGQYSPTIDKLTLSISATGIWEDISNVDGEACDGCKTSRRTYTLEVIIGPTTYISDNLVDFIVVPVDEGGEIKYQIRILQDIKKT